MHKSASRSPAQKCIQESWWEKFRMKIRCIICSFLHAEGVHCHIRNLEGVQCDSTSSQNSTIQSYYGTSTCSSYILLYPVAVDNKYLVATIVLEAQSYGIVANAVYCYSCQRKEYQLLLQNSSTYSVGISTNTELYSTSRYCSTYSCTVFIDISITVLISDTVLVAITILAAITILQLLAITVQNLQY